MDPITAMYLAQGIHGIAYGMALFLLASGLTLILGMMGVLNLAHTGFFMLAAYLGHQMVHWTGSYWVALAVAPLLSAVLGMLMEHFLLKKVHAYGAIAELILTMGVSLVILDGVKAVWGTESLPLSPPQSLRGLVDIAGLQYPAYRLFIIGLSVLVLMIMALVLYRTRLGMVVRAAVSDAEMVGALGVNVPMVFLTVFGIGTWMAGVAGVAIAPILTVSPGLAGQMGMDAFIVIIVGGFGSLAGAFLVSLICGLLSAFGIQFLPQFAGILIFVFMAVVLAVKPEGLFGDKSHGSI